MIRVRRVCEFKGEDVVLLAVDGTGLDIFLAALTQAEQLGSSRLQRRGTVHDFVIEAGAADIELDDDGGVWRLSQTKAVEIIEKLRVLSGSGHPGHHYVDDMLSPAPTLVLSRDEYISPGWQQRVKSRFLGTSLSEQRQVDPVVPSLTNTPESNMAALPVEVSQSTPFHLMNQGHSDPSSLPSQDESKKTPSLSQHRFWHHCGDGRAFGARSQ